MEENFDTINLEYVTARKGSPFVKLVAMVMVLIFISVPMFEFLIQFKPTAEVCTYGIVGSCGCVLP